MQQAKNTHINFKIQPLSPSQTQQVVPVKNTSLPRTLQKHNASIFRSSVIVKWLAFVMLATILYTRLMPAWMWVFFGFYCFIWPPIGHRLSRWSRPPKRFWNDRGNLLADHFFSGIISGFIGFTPLPSLALAAITSINTVTKGGMPLLYKGLALHVSGLCLSILFSPGWHPQASFWETMACLPLLIFAPLSIIKITYSTLQEFKLHYKTLDNRRKALEHISQHDKLTGLFNRGHWENLVRTEFKRFKRTGQSASLVLADLDHFKRINDVYGHAAGDLVLRRFSKLLHQNLREIDSAGRYGGEEFGILLPLCSAANAHQVIERIRLDLHDHPLLDNEVITASFGIVEVNAEMKRHKSWLRLADKMLYRAKHLGRDRIEIPNVKNSEKRGFEASPILLISALNQPFTLQTVLKALDQSSAASALFDAHDSLVIANKKYLDMHSMPPRSLPYSEIMRHCFLTKTGPVFDTEDFDAWLKNTHAVRRSQPIRHFTVKMVATSSLFLTTEVTLDCGHIWTTSTEIDIS